MACKNCAINARIADRITQLADSIVVGGLTAAGVPPSIARAAPRAVQAGALAIAKKKRAPSQYNVQYAKNYAALAKKHPRSGFAAIAKKAHAATKRGRK